MRWDPMRIFWFSSPGYLVVQVPSCSAPKKQVEIDLVCQTPTFCYNSFVTYKCNRVLKNTYILYYLLRGCKLWCLLIHVYFYNKRKVQKTKIVFKSTDNSVPIYVSGLAQENSMQTHRQLCKFFCGIMYADSQLCFLLILFSPSAHIYANDSVL